MNAAAQDVHVVTERLLLTISAATQANHASHNWVGIADLHMYTPGWCADQLCVSCTVMKQRRSNTKEMLAVLHTYLYICTCKLYNIVLLLTV